VKKLMQILELLLLAALAVLVLARLYMVLGKGGPGPEQRQAPVQRGDATDGFARKPLAEPAVRHRPLFTGPAADGLEAIAARDPQFEPDEFLEGAKQAYAIIVEAFAEGDRQTLRPLLTDDVYASYDQALRERTGKSITKIDRIRKAHISSADLSADVASVTVNFEVNLDSGDEHRFIDARENWTFERKVDDADPNWRLAAVTSAA
jgi:predicted lipid-binding transport protein (Tim44 family)